MKYVYDCFWHLLYDYFSHFTQRASQNHFLYECLYSGLSMNGGKLIKAKQCTYAFIPETLQSVALQYHQQIKRL